MSRDVSGGLFQPSIMPRVIDLSTTHPARREFQIRDDDRVFTLTLVGASVVFPEPAAEFDIHGKLYESLEPMPEITDAELRDCLRLIVNQLPP